ncbi:hypothetical protein [Sphaerisporangium sp. NPDC051011]|uniref:hypothetical protein n=1 Tax=Sphaerisporangium sp. NPDC051011 TaxID=3155792 RepID=UPI0033F19FB4
MAVIVAVTAVRAWINSLDSLVGKGLPLALGAFRAADPPRSPGQGAYALLSQVGGSLELVAEEGIGRARISATIYAGTDEAAEAAAVAYLNTLEALTGDPAPMGDIARCLVADDITGPVALPDLGYLIDADFYLTSI